MEAAGHGSERWKHSFCPRSDCLRPWLYSLLRSLRTMARTVLARHEFPVKPRPTVRVIKAHALRAPSELYKRSVRKPRVKHGGVSVFGTEATGISSQRFLPKAGRGTHQDAPAQGSQRRGYTAVSATTLGRDGNHHRALNQRNTPKSRSWVGLRRKKIQQLS